MKNTTVFRLFAALSFAIVSGCSSLPKNPPKEYSVHPGPATSGLLAEQSQEFLKNCNSEESVFKLLFDNTEALQWRLALIDSAQSTIDLQVFIWDDEVAGRLLLDRLMKAASRGVQVRLLIDDFPKSFSDDDIYLMSHIENIDMRSFNPGHSRDNLSGAIEMSAKFSKLNRRMHNKMILGDGTWAILGGRNIGDAYYGLDKTYNFRDLDSLITGPILTQLESAYDLYWNCDAAYPGQYMAKKVSDKKSKKLFHKFYETLTDDRVLLRQTPFPVMVRNWENEFKQLESKMIPGVATFLHDAPIVQGKRGKRLVDQIREHRGDDEEEMVIVSPYLIPSKIMIDRTRRKIKEGSSCTIVTASMDSNNHTMANSHYKKYRKPLLQTGVNLYEFSGQPGKVMREKTDTHPVVSDFVSLHIKAFVIDKRWLYMGSLNMDPRALVINTEDMLVIDSPRLAEQFLKEVELMKLPENSWAVTLNEKGNLRWTANEEVRKHQPSRGFGQRCADWFFRILPIESQL